MVRGKAKFLTVIRPYEFSPFTLCLPLFSPLCETFFFAFFVFFCG